LSTTLGLSVSVLLIVRICSADLPVLQHQDQGLGWLGARIGVRAVRHQ